MKIIKLIIFLFCIVSINLFSDNKLIKVDATNIGTSSENISVNINFDDIEYPSYVEELDYIELMSVNDINSFNNWINSLNINYTNQEHIDFINNNINKLILKAIKVGSIRDIFNTNTRYAGNSHSLILEHALDIFEYDGKFEVTNFYINYLNTLLNAVKAPDIDENIKGTHYYVYLSELSNTYYKNNAYINLDLSREYSISARTRFEEHYTAAINLYKNNKLNNAMDELGRALHYLQDVACSPHSLGITQIKSTTNILTGTLIPPNGHKYYEDWINTNYQYNSTYKTTTAIDVYNQVLNLDNPSLILNDIAQFSAASGGMLLIEESEPTYNPNTTLYRTMASECLPYAQKMTAAILNRFYLDVKSNTRHPQYIKDGAIYYIKNSGSGQYIDVKSWSTTNNSVTHMYNFTGDTNQQFRAELQSDGSFRFTPMHAFDKKLQVNNDNETYKLCISSNGNRFRIMYQEDNLFRIIPEYFTVNDLILNGDIEPLEIIPPNNYFRYPLAQSGTSILVNTLTTWEPESSAYLWKFEEAPFAYPGETNIYLGEDQIKKVVINVSSEGQYNIETIGNVNTYFVNLISRSGTGNTTTTYIKSNCDDDSGEGTNAKYSNVTLIPGNTYILTLRGYDSSKHGNTILKISGNTPNFIKRNNNIRTNTVYNVDDSGRFNNPYDTINLYSVYNQTPSVLYSYGYRKIKIKISIDIHEIDDGYQYIWIYNGSNQSSNIIGEQQIEHKVGEKDSNYKTYIIDFAPINLENINTNLIYLRYGASGNDEDTWENKNLKLEYIVY